MLPQKLGTYVYLTSLTDVDPQYAARAKTYSTFNPSVSINNKGKAIQPIRDAIAQLQNIASTQAQKEHQVIQNYLRKLNLYCEDEKLPEALRKNLQRQRDKIKNMDFNNYKTDSLNLIQAINVAIQNLNVYEKRLNEITTPIIKPYEFQQRFDFDAQSRLERFFQNAGKAHHGKYIDRDKTLYNLISKDKAFNAFPEELANELKSLIFIDFNNWVETQSSKKISYTKLTMQDIEPLFQEYTRLYDNQFTATHLQRIIQTSSKDLLQLAKDMRNFLHSTYITDNEYQQLLELREKAKNGSKKLKFRGENITYKQISDLITTYNYNLENNGKRYSFSLHSKVSHGGFYELMSTFLKSAVNIEGNVAGDLILPIGTVTFTEEEQQSQNILLQLSNGIQNILTKDFNERSQATMENFDALVQQEQKLHENIHEKINQAKQDIKNVENITEQFFIAHETTKLYRGAEQQESQFEDFHGRHMSALSAMAKLYASPTLSSAMIDPKMMMLYLINIDNATLAANKKPLETYLSLFAGLLMYDDISELATYNIKQIQSNIAMTESTVDCIHVYNIGGVYFPISVILNDLLSQMNAILTNLEIDNSKTATVEIIGPTPTPPEPSTPDSWATLADQVIQATKIQIHFLAAYSQYISELFSNYT